MWSEEQMVVAHSVLMADEDLTRVGLSRAAVSFVCDPTQRRNSASFVFQCVSRKRLYTCITGFFQSEHERVGGFCQLILSLVSATKNAKRNINAPPRDQKTVKPTKKMFARAYTTYIYKHEHTKQAQKASTQSKHTEQAHQKCKPKKHAKTRTNTHATMCTSTLALKTCPCARTPSTLSPQRLYPR